MIAVFLAALFDVVDKNDILLSGDVPFSHAENNSDEIPNDDLDELNYCSVTLPSFCMFAEKFAFSKPFTAKEIFAFIYTLNLLNNTKILTEERPPIA